MTPIDRNLASMQSRATCRLPTAPTHPRPNIQLRASDVVVGNVLASARATLLSPPENRDAADGCSPPLIASVDRPAALMPIDDDYDRSADALRISRLQLSGSVATSSSAAR